MLCVVEWHLCRVLVCFSSSRRFWWWWQRHKQRRFLRTSSDLCTPLPTVLLSRVSILLLTRDIDIVILSVRPSVRLSRYSRNSDGVTRHGGGKYRLGIKFARFSTNKSLYLANDTIYRHGCYGRRIGTHTRSITWCHFQWPWMNPNPVFKVRIFFDAEYLQNKKYVLWNAGICPIAAKVGHVTLATPPLGSFIIHY